MHSLQRPTTQDKGITALMGELRSRYTDSRVNLISHNTVKILLYEPQMDSSKNQEFTDTPVTLLDLECDDWLDPSLASNRWMLGRKFTPTTPAMSKIESQNKTKLWFWIKHEAIQKYGDHCNEWQIRECDHESWLDVAEISDVTSFLDSKLEDFYMFQGLYI